MSKKTLWIVLILVIVVGGLWVFQNNQETILKNDPVVVRLKNKLIPFFPEILNTVVLKGNKSYTLRKYKIHLCTEDENGNLYNDNMMTYVFLHELAHCLNVNELGHGKNFHLIFEDLLNRAKKFGLYDPSIPRIQNYCQNKKSKF
jgi:hypothetical protein